MSPEVQLRGIGSFGQANGSAPGSPVRIEFDIARQNRVDAIRHDPAQAAELQALQRRIARGKQRVVRSALELQAAQGLAGNDGVVDFDLPERELPLHHQCAQRRIGP